MIIDFDEFKRFCVTPSSPNSNKANSYVKAIQIVFSFLDIDSNNFNLPDYEKVKELYQSLNNKNSILYQNLHSFVLKNNQKSYLEGGFVNASLNYFRKFFENKGQNMHEEESFENLSSNKPQQQIRSKYINSLLAKPFVILSGNSGTGKTRIATRFAKYLEKKTDAGVKNHLLIPVGADWTDNTKILGYFNPLANDGKGEYVKSEILEFIETASDNPEAPFFLILDEMNLSHVERYFSDFLSAMESGEPILLYKRPEGCECSTPEKISLPGNLFITGTVNIDETTYMFSPKVLDRANVIEFKPEMNDILNNLLSDASDDEQECAEGGVAEGFMQLANEIRSGEIPEEVQPLLKGIKPILESFYKELEKCGFEFAYRTVKEIRLYAIAAFKTAEGEKPTATNIADIQILQKILPKIHGNKKQIGTLLDELEKLCEEKSLPNSLAKIQQMKDKLNRFQYASFI